MPVHVGYSAVEIKQIQRTKPLTQVWKGLQSYVATDLLIVNSFECQLHCQRAVKILVWVSSVTRCGAY